ncbi:ECF subfamily RNA polymerase sigma-24 subunit [Hyphomicrobium denitrificans 1NES1]|uniref:ECF subfamily RNA polymerase sigma-24 subunit n=1 Tax=Hyphomicrobium denitrificans 1NES1 TaxID=670307 RepID=N0B3J2_9HYPH|nr:sigma-70 family RNA polymerase sigma factor [Hyphomicrobium denitrificans]AGK58069.1 ECF subfamily RNA polymerase sigma-24 subunit [Hyphomicrobium denitrificans 1NES1]
MSRAYVAAMKTDGSSARPRPAAEARNDEAILVAEAGAGDSRAFGVLMERHLGGIVSIARRMLRDDAEAEDVAQEAFLRLWRSGATLEMGPAGIRPWLRRVVSNLCLDRVRGQGRVKVVEELPEVPEPAKQLAALESQDVQRRVGGAMQKLPERQRLALTLFHFEGLSQIEIGNILGVSDEAVESLLSRARRQLKADLKSEWESLRNDNEP